MATDEIDRWLEELGLSAYLEAFRDNDIDVDTLRLLTGEDLQHIGVKSVGHRRRMLEAIAALNRATQQQPEEKPSAVSAAPERTAGTRTAASERKQITVMFCDLVDSTALSARTDPEDMHELLTNYRGCIAEAVRRNRGFIAHYIGDGVFVYFGYPQTQEQDAERALRAGLAIIRGLAQLKPVAGIVPQVRIGIATGLVVVGNVAEGSAAEKIDVTGETPNLAARIQGLARANELMVAPSTRALAGDLFDCIDIGRFELKGLPDPVQVWRVTGERAVASRFEAMRSARRVIDLIGRESELARISDRLATAKTGAGQVVLVVSQPGFGKSRLVEEVHRVVGTRELGRLVLQCSPDQGQTPFYPLIRQIEYAAGIANEDTAVERHDKIESLLARIGARSPDHLAVILELLRIDVGDTPATEVAGTGNARARTLKTLLDLTEAALAKTSLLVIEDMHWADPSTVEFVEMVVNRVRNVPALVVVTARPEFGASWEHHQHVTVLRLDRLPAAELRRLVLDLAKPEELQPDIVERILARSDGVPLFAQELTRGILASGRQPGGALTIPSTLTESLLARLDGLDNGREIAQLASVVGREFPIDLLAAISDENAGAVREGVRRLVEAGIFVRRHSSFGEAAAFDHILLRDTAYDLLLRRERIRLHGKVALALEEQFPDMTAAMPQMLAHHFTEAAQHAKAIDYWELSGADAASRSSPVEAVSHYEKALDLLALLPADSAHEDRELALRVNMIGPLIAARGNSSPEVADAVEQMLDLHQRSGSSRRIVPALTLKWLAQLGGDDFDALHETALQIRAAAEGATERDRLLAHRIVGSTLMFRGELSAAVGELTAFMQLYDPGAPDPELSRIGVTNHAEVVMLCLAECHTLMGHLDEAEPWRQAIFARTSEQHHLHTLCQSLTFGGCWLAALAGNMEQFSFYAAELQRLVMRHDLGLWRGHAELLSGLADIDRGDVEAGFSVARRGVDTLITGGNAYLLTTWWMLYVEACERHDRPEEALEFLLLVERRIRAGELWLAAEFHRLRARFNWARGDEASAIEADLNQALAIARKQEAGLFEHRVRTDLERWLRKSSGEA